MVPLCRQPWNRPIQPPVPGTQEPERKAGGHDDGTAEVEQVIIEVKEANVTRRLITSFNRNSNLIQP